MPPCAKGGCDRRHPRTCPTCVDWTPSRSSRYYDCGRFLRSRIACDEPRAACATCPHHESGRVSVEQGRPNLSGRDWDDPDERADYMRRYMRAYRERKRKRTGARGGKGIRRPSERKGNGSKPRRRTRRAAKRPGKP